MGRYDDYDPMDIDPDTGRPYEHDFAGPGSALRAASTSNPRNLPCPTCHWPNRLTPRDVELGYQCDRCADVMEGKGEIDYYDGDDGEDEGDY